MKILLGISAALLVSTAPVQFASAKDGPIDLVKAAVTAEGGQEAMAGLKSHEIKGHGQTVRASSRRVLKTSRECGATHLWRCE